MTIKELRQNGYKVRVIHQRCSLKDGHLAPIRLFRDMKLQKDISSFGGETELQVTAPDGKDYVAIAKCSKKDQFNRKIANRIALGRLQAQIATL